MTTPTPPVAAAATEERCETTELIASQCAHCRRAAAVPSLTIQYRFNAMYEGACAVCDWGFAEGDRIGRLDDGGLACPDCCEELS